jgi:DUF1365 family protein
MVSPSLYRVRIGHRREAPVSNRFQNSSYMWHFDIDAPPRLPRFLRPLAQWRPSRDHLDVRSLLTAEGLPSTRVEVLTNLSVLGYVFNPISVYWAYDADDRLVAHVAEVHNTYGGRHAYVMKVDDSDGDQERVVSKAMYVSPFYPVDGSYRIRISDPSERVRVSVILERPGGDTFRASMSGRRVTATAAQLLRSFVRFPAAPLRGRVLIQLQGLRLWRRGLEVQPR